MKPKQKKTPQKLLSDKIADALTVKPRADIEDDQVFGTKPKTVTRGDFGSSDSEVEAAISDFRKRNVGLLSEFSKKYEGQVVSRKDLEESGDDDSSSDDEESIQKPLLKKKQDTAIDSDASGSENELSKSMANKSQESDFDDSESEGESDDYSIMQFKKQLNDDSEDEEGGSDAEEGSDDDEDDGDEREGFDISQMEEPMKEEFEHVKKQNITEEAKKGICVRNQLLLSLQNLLLSKYPETKTICNKKLSKQQPETKQTANEDSDEEIPSDTDNEEIPSDTDAEEENVKEVQTPKNKANKSAPVKKRKLEDYESDISNSHKAFKTFRDTSIQKWNDKTRLATATNIKNTPTNTVLQQISYILSDREKLVRRTQLKRSEYDIVGYKKPLPEYENQNGNETEVNLVTRDRKDNDEYIPEIFDDSDFYHQLLRELIECKSADISDPVQLSRQWIALQQMRSKMKRKVDTKASKGRKIKYVVHNQLVNFMAPEKSVSWTDESKNELYSSLFGKLFEQNNIGLSANVNGFKLKN
ncbi:hypothetical protein HF086_017758 [Spodoptera exigua]|uniref:Apoptosis-antagonizing transcription factor C-terminal domain-containing protein n=1 Tax=Spodoptera exigua TaxID=7107 RepID=A0A922MAV2_SPOEX|nr:hypothetical protein HF086_017758 [Spodoptera exigua]